MTQALALLAAVALGSTAAAQDIKQKTEGQCSPTFAGVTGNVQVTINCPGPSNSTTVHFNTTIEKARLEISRRQDEIAYWQAISSHGNRTEYQYYLTRYPHGLFADIAKNRLSHVDDKGFELDEKGERICQWYQYTFDGYRYAAKRSHIRFYGMDPICKMADGSWTSSPDEDAPRHRQ